MKLTAIARVHIIRNDGWFGFNDSKRKNVATQCRYVRNDEKAHNVKKPLLHSFRQGAHEHCEGGKFEKCWTSLR